MVINFLSNNINLIILTLMHLFFLQRRYIPIIICNLVILLCFYLKVNKMFCFEMSALLNIFSLTMHNRRFKISSVAYIIIISIGCFLLALKDLNNDLLISFYKNFAFLNKYIDIVNDLYIMISLLCIVGFIPFSNWMMYLFSISSSLFKIIIFITPMFLMFNILYDYKDSITSDSYQIFGFLICIVSCFKIMFNNNIRIIFVNVITYFYGMQIVSISKIYNLQLFNNWLIISFIILFLLNTITPIRTIKYNIANIKYFINEKLKKTLFFISLCLLFYFFLFVYIDLGKTKDLLKIISASIFNLFFIKILIFSCFFDNNSNQKKNLLINHDNDRLRIIRMILGVVFSIIYCGFNVSFLKNSLLKLNIYLLLFSLCIIILYTSSLFILNNNNGRDFIKNKSYSSFIVNFIKFLKIVSLIIQSVFIDFFVEIKNSFKKLSISSVPQKLSNILYGQYFYFYIFFLIEVIFVLTIECVIL